MSKKLDSFNQSQLKKDLPDIRPGDTIRVHQKISGQGAPAGGKEAKRGGKTQTFEGLVIARKHGKGVSATITVRRVLQGIGVERIFPIHSPVIAKIEVIKKGRVRRAKLYYLRSAKGKRARLKREEFAQAIAETPKTEIETPEEKPIEKTEQK
jgi:large subunit ribosomal protein L19